MFGLTQLINVVHVLFKNIVVLTLHSYEFAVTEKYIVIIMSTLFADKSNSMQLKVLTGKLGVFLLVSVAMT